jgi:2-oxoglutarate dehydrogenase complex dehydrogenase (E1) component-like enzyme
MSMMRELEQSSTLFGGNAPFIEDQYEIYLGDPGKVSPDWRAYFDTLRDGAQDVPQAPVVESFIQLAKNRRLAAPMVDAAGLGTQAERAHLVGHVARSGVNPAAQFRQHFMPTPAPAAS